MNLLVVFAGLSLFVSGCVIALAIYTRPWADKRCRDCAQCVPAEFRSDDECRVDGNCVDMRHPGKPWAPIFITGRCGPRGRFFVPR
jgi:hypothetical protein